MKQLYIFFLILSISLFAHSMQKPKPNLILDLDDVLIHEPSKELTNMHIFFSNNSFLIQDYYGYFYIVPAYLSEFLKYTHSQFNLAFFSGGDDQRNKSIVANIWMQIFGSEKPEDVPILGRKDLTYAERNKEMQPESDGLNWYGNKKKDVSKFGDLSNTILVDDDLSWVLVGQKANFLSAPGGDFSLLIEQTKRDETSERGESFAKYVEENITNEWVGRDLLAFYKLLYITGVLEVASRHKDTIVRGLYSIQFDEDNKPKFLQNKLEFMYYQIGFQLLSSFSDDGMTEHFPDIEKHFK